MVVVSFVFEVVCCFLEGAFLFANAVLVGFYECVCSLQVVGGWFGVSGLNGAFSFPDC